MIILVEGVDCAGKTTFVQELHRILPAAVLLKSGPPGPRTDVFDEYERRLYDALDAGKPVVCDRWHWGERVYGPVLRGQDRLGLAGFRHVELFLRAHGAVAVYLQQPTDVLTARLVRRGDDYVQPTQLRPLQLGYDRVLTSTILPTLQLRDPGPDDALNAVDLALRYDAPEAVPYFPSFIGQSWRPRALLFGERRGNGEPPPDRSAFVPRKTTSGYYLLKHLPEDLWGRIGLANALEEDPHRVWSWLQEPPVVALGVDAHKALLKAGVPHAAVPHPQFVRRFHHGSLDAYGQLIASVIGTQEDRIDWRGA